MLPASRNVAARLDRHTLGHRLTERILVAVEAQGAIKRLAPRVGDAVLAEGEAVRVATGDLHDVGDAIDKGRHVHLAQVLVADAQLAVSVAAHCVDIAALCLA